MCASLQNVPCSKCSEHIDGRSKYNDEDGKCVWIPESRACKTKEWAEKQIEKGKEIEFIEFCKGSLKFLIYENIYHILSRYSLILVITLFPISFSLQTLMVHVTKEIIQPLRIAVT